MEVKIIERLSIKPSSPTPNHLQTVNLSFFDQLSPSVCINVIFFYTADDNSATAAERSNNLKDSLSNTLTRFYPLAGRVEGNKAIVCCDQGAEYVDARVDCFLADVLRCPDKNVLEQFVPEMKGIVSSSDELLKVQANFFRCGGMAISVAMSHKIADAATFSTFIKDWTLRESMIPEFTASLLFPAIDFSLPAQIRVPRSEGLFSRKRFVFDAPKISFLQDKIAGASAGAVQPTRVEAVSALIWKCAIAASESSSSSWCHAVNMRRRAVPPISDYIMGNLANIFLVAAEKKDIELHCLAEKLRKGIEKFTKNGYVEKIQGDNGFAICIEDFIEVSKIQESCDTDLYICSSWCKFGWYEADFGWGNPKWVTPNMEGSSNFIMLMDAQNGDDIEAWVTLSCNHMDSFECNQELLLFASLNPSAIN